MNRQASSNNRKAEPEIIDGEVLGHIKEKSQQTLAKRFHANLVNRVSESTRGAPGQSPIAIRRGFLHANTNDLARYEAYKGIDDLYILLAGLFARQGRYAAHSHQVFTEALRLIHESVQELPEDMQPYGQALTQIAAQLMAETYTDSVALLRELGLEQLRRAYGH
jgi:hypothetical protein